MPPPDSGLKFELVLCLCLVTAGPESLGFGSAELPNSDDRDAEEILSLFLPVSLSNSLAGDDSELGVFRPARQLSDLCTLFVRLVEGYILQTCHLTGNRVVISGFRVIFNAPLFLVASRRDNAPFVTLPWSIVHSVALTNAFAVRACTHLHLLWHSVHTLSDWNNAVAFLHIAFCCTYKYAHPSSLSVSNFNLLAVLLE
jgi:hypothetical protein